MEKLSFPVALEHSGAVLCLLFCCILAYAFNDQLIAYLGFQQSQFVQGQIWRAMTSHVFHTNFAHLLLNLGGLVLLWALHGEQYSTGKIVLVYSVTTLGIAMGIALFSPDIQQYVGLSGMLHGLFIWGACNDIKLGRISGYALIVGACIKIGSEQWQGPDAGLGGLIDATVAIDAHLYGALAGFLAFAITQFFFKAEQPLSARH